MNLKDRLNSNPNSETRYTKLSDLPKEQYKIISVERFLYDGRDCILCYIKNKNNNTYTIYLPNSLVKKLKDEDEQELVKLEFKYNGMVSTGQFSKHDFVFL